MIRLIHYKIGFMGTYVYL